MIYHGVTGDERMSSPPFDVGQIVRLKVRVWIGQPRRWMLTEHIAERGRVGTVTKVSGAHWWKRSECEFGPCVQVRFQGARRPAWYWCGFFSPK